MAAMSLTFTTIALCPRSRAPDGPRTKCTSSTIASVVMTSSPPGRHEDRGIVADAHPDLGTGPGEDAADRLEQSFLREIHRVPSVHRPTVPFDDTANGERRRVA